MPRRFLVGLTGSLGSGKSTALRVLAKAGAAVASADEAAHALSGPRGPVTRAAARLFGREVLRPDGGLDRRAVARRVFSDPAARRRLEKAAHPLILRETARRLASSRSPVAVVDAPLLFEAGLASRFDLTVTVSAKLPAALSRVRRRSQMSRAEALRRRAAQWPDRRKEAAADVVVRNDGTLQDFTRKIREHYRAWELIARGSVAAAARQPR